MKILGRAAIGLALLTTAGCAPTLNPALPPQMAFVTLSTSVSVGKIQSPEPTPAVSVRLHWILRVEAVEYPGFTWHFGTPQNTKSLSYFETEAPGPCPSGIDGCTSTSAEQYSATAAGTTKIVFTLIASGNGSQPPAESAGARACPAGITAPPPSADVGCVLGMVTLTVKVG
jgi:hypothetical protein